MAHYAFLDTNNIVTEVIVGRNEWELDTDWEQYYSEFRGQTCVRTSYNGNIRKNFAGIGFTYDSTRDAFIPPKPYPSWILNEQTCTWQAPVAMPSTDGPHIWNESTLEWITLENNQ